MKKLNKAIGGVFALGATLALVAAPVFAASSVSTNFDSYTLGDINGQDGWSKTGPYDVNVVNNSYGYPAFGSQSLRVSNGVTSGSFGDQTFSKSLAEAAGESTATTGGYSAAPTQKHFEAQFDIASTMPTQQTGMAMSVSPDRGDGSRMSYLRFVDDSSGIDVFFDDVQGTTNPANFVETQVANDLSRTTPQTIKFVVDFVDGPSNDVVKIYINNALVHTGTTWENYYRYDTEASAEQGPRTTDSLHFRTGGTAVPANQGNGFLFDNLSLSSGPVQVGPPTTKDQCKHDGWKTFNNPSFKNQGQCIKWVEAKAHGDLKMADPSQSIKFNVANQTDSNDSHHDWHHDGDKRGNDVEYWNYDYPGVLHYKADVSCSYVNPQTNEARFMFQIPAGHPGLSGLYVVAYVKEVKQEHSPDLYGHAATADLNTATQWCQTGDGFSPTMYAVTKGNVEVE